MSEPVNRTILLFDIERFGRRDDVEQTFLRRSLHGVVEDTLLQCGVERTQQYREDRGDGLIILVSADVPKVALLRALITTTPAMLHHYNRLAARSTQMRVRTVLASGEITAHPQPGTTGGLVGHDLNQAFRLLDAPVLREALRERTADPAVLCVSDSVYQGTVRHGHPGLPPEDFHPVDVQAKEGPVRAWLLGPVPEQGQRRGQEAAPPTAAHPAPPGTPATGAPSPSAAPAQTATPTPTPAGGISFGSGTVVGGSVVGGDQHGVSGGTVDGDVVLGGRDTATGSPREERG